MSPYMLQIFAFMLATFVLGLALGWLVWRFGGGSRQAMNAVTAEIDFWRSNLEQCRMELSNEQNTTIVLREEKKQLKRRLSAAEQR